MDYFYENDSFEWGDTDGATRSGTANSYFTGSAYAESNSHVAPVMCEAEDMGSAVRSIRETLKSRTEKY